MATITTSYDSTSLRARIIIINWTADASGVSYNLPDNFMASVAKWYLYQVITTPDLSNPPSSYDLKLFFNGDTTYDLLGSAGSGRSATNTETITPPGYLHMINSLSLSISSSAGNGKKGQVKLIFIK